MIKSVIWPISGPPLTLGLCQCREGAHGRGSSGQQGINSLSQILMALAHWNSRSHDSSAPPPNIAALFTLYIFLARALVYVFGVVLSVCGPASPLPSSLSPSLPLCICLFGFTQPKPWQRCWLRGLCIPLGWWRGLSSVHSLRPGADRSFTSTSLSNTPLDMRQHPAKRSAGGTHTHWQTLTASLSHTHTHTHTHRLWGERGKKREDQDVWLLTFHFQSSIHF